MSTITAKTIIDKAVIQLTDISGVRWTRAELLGWINDAQRQIVIMSPNATNKISVVKLNAGTRQSLPSDGWTLLEVVRYMGTTGTKAGRAIRLASREQIDSFNPDWHSDTPAPVPRHYIFDLQDQTAFFVYPPNTGTGYVEINYSPDPADLTTETSVIYLNNIFETAILDYVLYRACSKDAEYAPGLQLAQGYLTTFMASMAAKAKSEADNSPNQQFATKDPNKAGSQS